MIGSFCILLVQLINLQVRNYEVYGERAQSKRTKTMTLKGPRGQIQDANGIVLAYDKKMYNVQFYRQPRTGREQNGRYSKAIWEVIKIVEKAGGTVISDFWLKQDETGQWVFDVGEGVGESVVKNRENMWRSNFYVKNLDQQKLFDELCYFYMLDENDEKYPIGEILTVEEKRKILAVWQAMQMNAFSSKPITIASDIDWATVIEIETRLITLDGISIAVENQRVYPQGTLACHIIGYTGLMQSKSQIEEYQAKGYAMNDSVGLDGVEKSMEEWLTANSLLRQGSKTVEVNNAGLVVRELAYVDSQDGNNIRLTIQSDLQRVAEKALADVINNIRTTQENTMRDHRWLEDNKEALETRDLVNNPIKLATNGAIVVLDMQARVLAMASHPNYDPNLFIIGMDEAQFQRTMLDERKPLFNNAIGSRDTPGSIFKMVTAMAAMTNGYLTPDRTITDEGPYTKYDTVNPPRCWASNTTRLTHKDQTVVDGLLHSCNYFFFTIASDMFEGGYDLYSFAAKLGLTSKTIVDLPWEARSVVGSQVSLYDTTRAITESAQDTSRAVLVQFALKRHLQKIGEMYNITYSEDRLDRTIKSLMDMAVNTPQTQWVRSIRPVLMEELGMSLEMVYRQVVVGDIYLLLNEIKWGGSEAIMTAIGQSITLLTPLAVARYVTAIANGGYVYDVSLIDSIVSPNGDIINPLDTPVVVNDLSAELKDVLTYIKKGMEGVVDESGTAGRYFEDWKYKDEISGKTGTAEKSELDLENNAWFVSFAPREKPEIVVVVYVPNGMSAGYVTPAAKAVIEHYLDSKQDVQAVDIPAPNTLAP